MIPYFLNKVTKYMWHIWYVYIVLIRLLCHRYMRTRVTAVMKFLARERTKVCKLGIVAQLGRKQFPETILILDFLKGMAFGKYPSLKLQNCRNLMRFTNKNLSWHDWHYRRQNILLIFLPFSFLEHVNLNDFFH